MTREEIIDFCDMKSQLEPENEDIFNYIIKTLEQKPCEDAVSRKEVKEAIMKCETISEDSMDGYIDSTTKLEVEIDCIPSVTPTRKKGKWIFHEKSVSTGFKDLRECSCCRCYFRWEMPRNSYCPNCGAEMESEDGE